MSTKWPSIVQLAADYAQAIAEAVSDERWRAPLRAKYADLLLTLMRREPGYTAAFVDFADRFERVLDAAPSAGGHDERGSGAGDERG